MIFLNFLKIFEGNTPGLNKKYEETINNIEENCSYMLDLANQLPESGGKQKLIEELTKQSEIVSNHKKRKP